MAAPLGVALKAMVTNPVVQDVAKTAGKAIIEGLVKPKVEAKSVELAGRALDGLEKRFNKPGASRPNLGPRGKANFAGMEHSSAAREANNSSPERQPTLGKSAILPRVGRGAFKQSESASPFVPFASLNQPARAAGSQQTKAEPLPQGSSTATAGLAQTEEQGPAEALKEHNALNPGEAPALEDVNATLGQARDLLNKAI